MVLISSSAFRYAVSIFLFFCIFLTAHAQITVFNIEQFGAVADGATDNSQALSSAWSQACQFQGPSEVLVPQGTFLVLPLMLQGPCNGSVQLQIEGILMASSDRSYASGDYWLAIHQVNDLVVDGSGSFDGQGASAWPFNACTGNSCPVQLPVSVKFDLINTATIRNIKSINSKYFHFTVFESQSITFDGITLSAPADSPNTDGIHISQSTDIAVLNSIIGTGDDCISLGPGSRSINISNVQCGPGHGISIGSLGLTQNEDDVVGVTVRNSTFLGTDNGVRIKTWSTPYPSLVSDVTFIHLTMNDVGKPIIIDQSYCPHDSCNTQNQASGSMVQIQGVRYEDIRGTSKTQVAAEFGCSQVVPCKDIVLQDINLAFSGDPSEGAAASSTCSNVEGAAYGEEIPPPCF